MELIIRNFVESFMLLKIWFCFLFFLGIIGVFDSTFIFIKLTSLQRFFVTFISCFIITALWFEIEWHFVSCCIYNLYNFSILLLQSDLSVLKWLYIIRLILKLLLFPIVLP